MNQNTTQAPEFANVVWLRRVQEHAREFNVDFNNAWQGESKLNKSLFTLMLAVGATGQHIECANAKLAVPRDPPWVRMSKETQAESNATPPTESIASLRGQLHQEVAQFQRDTSATYDEAFRAVIAREKFARLRESPMTSEPISKELTADPKFYVSVARRATALHFLMPEEADVEEVFCAFEANGRRAYPIRFGSVFNALVNLWQTRRGVAFEQGIAIAKERYPRLWQATSDLANG